MLHTYVRPVFTLKNFSSDFYNLVEVSRALSQNSMYKGSIIVGKVPHVFQFPTISTSSLNSNPFCFGMAYTSKSRVYLRSSLTKSRYIGKQLLRGKFSTLEDPENHKIVTDLTEPTSTFSRQVPLYPSSGTAYKLASQYHTPVLSLNTSRFDKYPISPLMGILNQKIMFGNFVASALFPRRYFEIVLPHEHPILLYDPGIKHSAIEFLRDFRVHGVVKYDGDYALDAIRGIFGYPRGDDLVSLWRASKFLLDLSDKDYNAFLNKDGAALRAIFDAKLSAASNSYGTPSSTLRDALVETYNSDEFF